jgi:hypothetical protein
MTCHGSTNDHLYGRPRRRRRPQDDVTHEHLVRFDWAEGVLFIGRAQEKTQLFRTERPARPEEIDGLLRKWLAILPHQFTTADRAAGYRYDISIWQPEFSLTQVLVPRAGTSAHTAYTLTVEYLARTWELRVRR